MSGGGTTQQVTQNKDPWAPAVPHLEQIMQQGQDLYNSGAGTAQWGGPLVAPQSSQTQMGINALTGTAQGQQATAGQPLAYGQNLIQNNGLTSAYTDPMNTYKDIATGAALPTAAQTYLTGMASGADAGKDPYLTQMLDDNASRVGNRVASQMSGSGRLGSFGYGDAMARSITAANAPILSAAYENDKNRQLSATGQIDQSRNAADATRLGATTGQTNALNFGQQNAAQWGSMIPSLQTSSYMPGNTMLGIGALQDAYNQRGIDASRQQFEQQQAMPWTQLARYSGAVSGLSPLMANAGSMTGTQDTQKQLGFQDYAQMFGGGANSAVAGMANAGSAGLGALGSLGSALGPLAMFSDRTAKTDIKKLGPDPETGVMMYAYRYRDDPKSYPKVVGPMAQDIEKMLPGATVRVGGKLAVKREALGILGL